MKSSRVAMGIVAFVMLLTTTASNAPSPLYVIYQGRFHFSPLTLTAVFATYAGAVMVALFTVGHLSDVIGRRAVLVPGLLLLAASAALFAAATSTGWLFAARAVQGLATGGITGAATAALVELEPSHDRQRASYINTLAFIMGAAVGPLLFGVAAQYSPAPLVLPFAVEGGLAIVAVILVRLLPETVPPGRAERSALQLQRPSVPRAVRGPFAVAVLALCVAWGLGGLFGALSPSIDKELLHVSNHAAAGAVLFVFAGIGGASQLRLRRWPPRRSIGIGTAVTAAGIALVDLGLVVTNVPVFLVGTLLAGGGSGLGFMGSLALVNEVAPPARRAEVISAWNLIGYVALSAPALGVGRLTGMMGLRDATGVFAASVVILSIVVVITVARLPSRPLAGLTESQLVELGLDPAAVASGTG